MIGEGSNLSLYLPIYLVSLIIFVTILRKRRIFLTILETFVCNNAVQQLKVKMIP